MKNLIIPKPEEDISNTELDIGLPKDLLKKLVREALHLTDPFAKKGAFQIEKMLQKYVYAFSILIIGFYVILEGVTILSSFLGVCSFFFIIHLCEKQAVDARFRKYFVFQPQSFDYARLEQKLLGKHQASRRPNFAELENLLLPQTGLTKVVIQVKPVSRGRKGGFSFRRKPSKKSTLTAFGSLKDISRKMPFIALKNEKESKSHCDDPFFIIHIWIDNKEGLLDEFKNQINHKEDLVFVK